MSATWHSPGPPPAHPRAPGGLGRVIWRGGRLALVIGGGVVVTLVLRLVERPLHGVHRPWTPAITVWVSRRILAILGLAHAVEGVPMRGPGAVVANHVSWLDIFVLNACCRVIFVSKAEVARWPGIGFLASLVGTVFIARDPRAARAQTEILQARLAAGQRLVLFPEGTSTDGLRLRPFKSTLFEALRDGETATRLRVQPVTLVYEAPVGADPRFYGWWGDMEFGAHLIAMLGAPRHGRVRVIFHAPLEAGASAGRKPLAAAAEAAVRAGLPEGQRGL